MARPHTGSGWRFFGEVPGRFQDSTEGNQQTRPSFVFAAACFVAIIGFCHDKSSSGAIFAYFASVFLVLS